MWLNELSYADNKFTGTLNYDPRMVSNVKTGDEKTVTPNEITDWMYFEGNEIVGGYTVAVLEKRIDE